MIRTRFAPSPTGYVHVGNIRTALFAYLTARNAKGDFIIRIEDTDQSRFIEDAEKIMLDALVWLGIDWNEGPNSAMTDEIGGYAPYHQTARKDIYKKYAELLLSKGRAYADPYSSEEIEDFRKKATNNKRPFLYRNHRPENPPIWDGSRPLRFKADPKNYAWNDLVMGNLSAGADAIDDFILIKSDGLPTYNFAHIVDDIEMKITHVIRGQDFVSSMPNYLNLYDALEVDRPLFAHLPLILAPSGNKKLGKRDGAKSITEYESEGFLPEAMLNFLATLGWNDGTSEEIYSKEDLIKKFNLNRVQKSGARFDEKKLLWLNSQWMRKLTLDDLYARSESFWGTTGKHADKEYKKQVLALAQDRLKTLTDLPDLTEYFFTRPEPNLNMIKNNKQLSKIPNKELKKLIQTTIKQLKSVTWDVKNIQVILNELLETTSQKPNVLFQLLRLSLTWAPFSPGLPETMTILGQGETLARLQQSMQAL